MGKNEFLKGLEAALLEYMDISEAAPHIRYYQDYIENEIKNGKNEQDVIRSLQNPRLIAKTLVNSYSSRSDSIYENDSVDDRNSNNRSRMSFSINGKPINSTFFKIIMGLVLILFLMLILVIVGGVLFILFRFVLPVVLVVGLVCFVIKVIKNNL